MKAEARIAELEKVLAVVRSRLPQLASTGSAVEMATTLVEMIDKVLVPSPSTRLERLIAKQNRREP